MRTCRSISPLYLSVSEGMGRTGVEIVGGVCEEGESDGILGKNEGGGLGVVGLERG